MTGRPSTQAGTQDSNQLAWRYERVAQRYVADGSGLRYCIYHDGRRWVVVIHETCQINGAVWLRISPTWFDEIFVTLDDAQEWAGCFESSADAPNTLTRNIIATDRWHVRRTTKA